MLLQSKILVCYSTFVLLFPYLANCFQLRYVIICNGCHTSIGFHGDSFVIGKRNIRRMCKLQNKSFLWGLCLRALKECRLRCRNCTPPPFAKPGDICSLHEDNPNFMPHFEKLKCGIVCGLQKYARKLENDATRLFAKMAAKNIAFNQN